ncbi:hypothetical protein PLICRDRAFT_360701 [Plicaturopsis crispa FD-325 SS-3]|uniref:F-box domain-containing protein n=1 Tax=Plicaturopsis crispa FD-325 SS-3 TaxID=944288 RepID=A0A0C9T4S6_PLICR|nr:hypothetical protein PLICRDRAFT_360701 [Plicaturopsis crispa FD-325 SS-3]
MTSRATAMLPSELLDIIFSLFYHDICAGKRNTFMPVLYVNKQWHAVAERRMYASLEATNMRLINILLVCATLENPNIAALVKEVHLEVELNDDSDGRYDARLLQRCPLASVVRLQLQIRLYSAWASLGRFKSSLAQRPWLTDLAIVGLACTVSEVLSMLKHWPKLEKLVMQYLTADTAPTAIPTHETFAPNCCPSLRIVDIKTCLCLSDRDLQTLATLAPAVHDFSAVFVDSSRYITSAGLCVALCLWAPRLQSLFLQLDALSIENVYPALSHLTALRTSSDLISVQLLSNTGYGTRIARLHYTVTSPHELEQFATYLRNVKFMPALRVLTVDSCEVPRRDSLSSHVTIARIAAERGIDLTVVASWS